MDIPVPHVDGLAATKAITADERLTDVRIVIRTTFDLDEYVFEALRSGASGFPRKDTDPDDLINAVRTSRPATRCSRHEPRAASSPGTPPGRSPPDLSPPSRPPHLPRTRGHRPCRGRT